MTMQEQENTAKLLSAALRGFPHSKADDETVAFYVVSLDDLSFGEVRAAIIKLCRTAKFFPTIAEIREAVDSLKTSAQGQKESSAGEAWEEAMNLVRTCHVYKPWAYSSPEVEQAVKQFGQMELIELKANDINTARAQFMRIFNSVVERAKDRAHNKAVLEQLGINLPSLDGGRKPKALREA